MGQTETRSDLPSTRAEAKRLGYKYYFTGKPCKHGHRCSRQTSNGCCVDCHRESYNRWYKDNRSQVLKRCERWRNANPERHRSNHRKWHWENRQRSLERCRKWRLYNPTYSFWWHRNNREKTREKTAARRAIRLRQTPAWSDRKMIQGVYSEAQRLTDSTGVEHHVDHIYPLQGDTVSGLHVAENLEPVPAHINRSKNNTHPDEYYNDESE